MYGFCVDTIQSVVHGSGDHAISSHYHEGHYIEPEPLNGGGTPHRPLQAMGQNSSPCKTHSHILCIVRPKSELAPHPAQPLFVPGQKAKAARGEEFVTSWDRNSGLLGPGPPILTSPVGLQLYFLGSFAVEHLLSDRRLPEALSGFWVLC